MPNHQPATASREAERKYALPSRVDDAAPGRPLGELLDLERLGAHSPERVDVLVADYSDTPELDLLRAKITLRRRTGGGDAGWHLKTPGRREGDDVRGEVRLPLTAGLRVPASMRAMVADLVGERPLLPIVRLTTVRGTTELYRADGSVRAELCRDRVTAEVRRCDALRELEWSELELELAPDEPTAAFDELEPMLLDAGCVRDHAPSKLARILADVPPMPDPDFGTPAAEAVAALMAVHFGRLQSLEVPMLANEPDAVHQARVAMRRMRSHLQAFRRVFDRADAERLREEMRWAGERCSEARDAEVLGEELDALLDGLDGDELVGPVRERIDSAIAERHRKGLTRMRQAVASARWDAFMASAAEFLVDAPASGKGRRPAGTVLPKLVDRAIERVVARTERADADPADLERWHEVRKGAKRVRYAFETLEALELPGAEQRRRAWKAIAEDFGEIQDAAILGEQLAAFERGAEAAGEPLDTYELLRDRLGDRRDERLERVRGMLGDALAEHGG
ncbi:MAG: CYTH and CHAD domain-containing protein [Microbacteriaceae bacterium]|nr:CYTH and CHAD domain-containing protein [Microbacteriaceae bacterium]